MKTNNNNFVYNFTDAQPCIQTIDTNKKAKITNTVTNLNIQ